MPKQREAPAAPIVPSIVTFWLREIHVKNLKPFAILIGLLVPSGFILIRFYGMSPFVFAGLALAGVVFAVINLFYQRRR